MDKITIPIGEEDIEVFKDLINNTCSSFIWTFHTKVSDEEIGVEFVSEYEDEEDETPQEVNEWLRSGGW